VRSTCGEEVSLASLGVGDEFDTETCAPKKPVSSYVPVLKSAEISPMASGCRSCASRRRGGHCSFRRRSQGAKCATEAVSGRRLSVAEDCPQPCVSCSVATSLWRSPDAGVEQFTCALAPGTVEAPAIAGAECGKFSGGTSPQAHCTRPLSDLSTGVLLGHQMCNWYFNATAWPEMNCEEWVAQHVVVMENMYDVGLMVTVEAGAQNKEKPLVVFIHGWPDTAAEWINQMMAMCGQFRCVAVQLPDFLDTLETEDVFLDQVVTRVGGVLAQHLGVSDGSEKALLIGHDFGAVFGYMVAYKYPNMVERYASLEIGNDLQMWHDAKFGTMIHFYQNAAIQAYKSGEIVDDPSKVFGSMSPSQHATARMGGVYARMWAREEFQLRLAPRVRPEDWQSLYTPLGGTGIPQPGMLFVYGARLAVTDKFVEAVQQDGGKVVQLADSTIYHWPQISFAMEVTNLLQEWASSR